VDAKAPTPTEQPKKARNLLVVIKKMCNELYGIVETAEEPGTTLACAKWI
jgi:hypothetical protein